MHGLTFPQTMSLPYLRKTLAAMPLKPKASAEVDGGRSVSPQSKLKVIVLLVVMSVISAVALSEMFSPSSFPSIWSLLGMDEPEPLEVAPEKKADTSKKRVTVETSLGEETVSVTVAV